MVGEPLDGQEPREVLGEQAKHLRLVQLAQQVHAPLRVAGRLDEARSRECRERAGIGRFVQQPVVEQLVEEERVARNELGRPAGGADDARYALERLRMLGE